MSAAEPRNGRGGGTPRQSTATANFGSGRREAHDASAFYARFVPPEVSRDETVNELPERDVLHLGDARDMSQIPDCSVALVVTSPPYFAGKQYEEDLGADGVPSDYLEYLELLHDVFAECARVLEPGGRIAVNVANLGRKPYRSLSGDVTTILSDLGLLLRGEVVWWKGRAAGGSCAWGSFQRPANPVLRDVTERIVVAGKGRFDRAVLPAKRAARGLPSVTTISRDEFMEATTDLWEIAPESARRVGHPAPFPVELPERLIGMYTYEGDVVLDPFMGSGSTAVAAVRTARAFVGFDMDAEYLDIAERRVDAERARIAGAADHPRFRVRLPATKPVDVVEDPLARAVREGRQVKEVALTLLEACGFADIRSDVRLPALGLELNVVASDQLGREWVFDVSGAFTSTRSGLRRTDTLWKALGKAAVLRSAGDRRPLVLLTTDAPVGGSAGDKALRALRSADDGGRAAVFDVVELLDAEGRERLRTYAREGGRGA